MGRWHRGRAQVLAREAAARSLEAPRARPGGGATGGAAAPCRHRLPAAAPGQRGGGGCRWAHILQEAAAGGGWVWRRAGRPAAPALLSANGLALFPPPRLTPCPQGPSSAVLVCPQPSSFSPLERLRPPHLEDLGGFSEHHGLFGPSALRLC